MDYHLRLYHVTKWDDYTTKGWYTRVNEKHSHEYEPLMTVSTVSGPIAKPYALAIFVVPGYARVRRNARNIAAGHFYEKWHFEDKLPTKGMHLKPFGPKLPRTQDLLQATRGLLLFSNYFEPGELLTPEGMAYWLGYHYHNFVRYYQTQGIVDMIFKGHHNVPKEYHDGLADYLMERSL